MLKINNETPGFAKCLEFNDSTSLHCVFSCKNDGVFNQHKKGIDICINVKLQNGGSATVVLPIENKKELKLFLDYIKNDFNEMFLEE